MGTSANHGSRDLTEPEPYVKINKVRADFKEISENKTLKPLDTSFLKKMMTSFFQTVPNKKIGKQSSVFNTAALNTAIVICDDAEDAENTLKKLNQEIIMFMNDYIEEEMGESCQNYFRTHTLFESKIEGNKLMLTWQ